MSDTILTGIIIVLIGAVFLAMEYRATGTLKTALGGLWFFLAIGAVTLAIGLAAAYGHDDAKWIQEKHPECCGIEDCTPIPLTAVYRDRIGWRVDSLDGWVVPQLVRPSIDHRPWACSPIGTGMLHCLFLPAKPLRM